MQVKIGDHIISSDDEPIMLILSSHEKELISDMGEQTRFGAFPEHFTIKDRVNFMHGRNNNGSAQT